MPADVPVMDLVDIHGYVHQVSVEYHKNALGLGWGLFFGSIVLNIIYYKLHPAAPTFAVTSDDKLRTHVCGTVWNWKKCVCGGNLIMIKSFLINSNFQEDVTDDGVEVVVDASQNANEEALQGKTN